ncbi:MAG: hypothetical protein QM776_06420 [Rhodocyclaceae bacterium]
MKSVRSIVIAALGAASLFSSLPGQARESVNISLPGASIRLPAPPLLPGVSVRLPAPPLPGVVIVDDRRDGGYRDGGYRHDDWRRERDRDDDWRRERARDDWRHDRRPPPYYYGPPPRHHHHRHYDRW